jgi:enoyl-CoA hydratase/carnithine racemase
MGASIVLRELVRMDVAKELTMTGRIISGKQAEQLGLVTRCVDDPMDEAMKVAKEIIQRSPDSVATTKELFQSMTVVVLWREVKLGEKLVKKMVMFILNICNQSLISRNVKSRIGTPAVTLSTIHLVP